MLTVVFLTISIFAIVMSVMAVGVIFSNRCLRGSCGGPEVLGPNGESLSCETCPIRKEREARAAAMKLNAADG